MVARSCPRIHEELAKRHGHDNATMIPGHRVRGSAPVTIMINLNTRDSSHELMEIKHDRIPPASSTNKRTSGSDNLTLVPQSAQVCSRVGTVETNTVLIPNVTLLKKMA